MARVLLKFQDSSGFIVRSVAADSLGASLRKVVEAVGAHPAGLRDTGEGTDERGVEICTCSHPRDTLILEFADGSLQAYLFYCFSAHRETPEASLHIPMETLESRKMSIRWDKVRTRYCSKGYGCADGPREAVGWEVLDETRYKDGWIPHASGRLVGEVLEGMLNERGLPPGDFGIRLSLSIDAGKVKEVVLDSAAPRS